MPQVAYEYPFQLFMKKTLILLKIEISSTKTMRSPDSHVGRGGQMTWLLLNGIPVFHCMVTS